MFGNRNTHVPFMMEDEQHESGLHLREQLKSRRKEIELIHLSTDRGIPVRMRTALLLSPEKTFGSKIIMNEDLSILVLSASRVF